jgi:hypothetical protein
MPIRFQKWITRQDLKNNPHIYFVFGDNVARTGLGGQAAEMRGEPNAIGVVTKWWPSMDILAFFTDEYYSDEIINDMDKIQELVNNDKTVVIPTDGLGTGLSMLPRKAPKLYERMYKTIEVLYGQKIPWEPPTNS